MYQIRISILLFLLASVATAGCCTHRPAPAKCCPAYVSQRVDQWESVDPNAGDCVYASFANLPDSAAAKRSVFDQLPNSGVIKIDLQGTLCMAARNSSIADLIDAERHALDCQNKPCRTRTLDLLLQGEAMEERNKAAGAAGELFLELVKVGLQRQLADESSVHLDQLGQTLAGADDAGFATADGNNELAAGRVKVNTARSELDVAEQRLTYQLNMLLTRDADSLMTLEPVHQVDPVLGELAVASEVSLAETNRPGIRAMESALQKGADLKSVYQLLGNFDPRLGIESIPLPPIKKILLRRQLADLAARENAPDVSVATRRQQLLQLIDARKAVARTETLNALLTLQASIEKLAIMTDDIARLDLRKEKLEAKRELKTNDSMLELNQNWVRRQQVRSDRINVAIEYEIAKIKLLQAQGQLSQQCGYDLEADECRQVCCECE